MTSNISVLGLGNWGTALANHLAKEGHQVLGWTIDEDVVASINQTQRNCQYLSHVELSANFTATGQIQEALENSMLVLAVPSAALSQVVPQIQALDGAVLVSAIKGIEVESLLTPLEYCRKFLPVRNVSLVVLSGPSFARDVVVGKPAGVIAASQDSEAAEQVARCFHASNLRVYLSDDPLGVELGGILKNVIALAVGVVDGIGLGDSARAGLITRGLAEMMRLAKAMGADVQTLSGLSGLGDLIMTATCDTSRNRTVGLRLGKGESLQHIIDTLGSVAEGVKTTPLALRLAAQHSVEMPISAQVEKLLSSEITAQEMITNLVTRPMKSEFEAL